MNPAGSAPQPWRESLAAARANLAPGLVLQAFALLVLLAYFFHGPSHHALDALAALKTRWGWRYSLAATSLFGGLIPFLVMRMNRGIRAATPLSHGLFFLLFWAEKGVEVDFFYRFQGWLFGNHADIGTVAAKVLFDQLVYSVIWSTPTALIAFRWKDSGFRFGSLPPARWIPYLKAVMPKALFGLWGVWIPAVTIIYCLPPALQIPLFNIVLCFYALLFTTLSRDPANSDPAVAVAATGADSGR